MRRATIVIGVLLTLQSLKLAAQTPGAVMVGQRVRLTTDSGPWIGTLVRQDSGGLTLQGPGLSDSSVVTVSVDRIRRIDVSLGRQSNAGKGAAIGFGVGATLGLVAGIACASSDSFLQCTTGDVVQATLGAGLMGAGVGALIGLASNSEHWEPVSTGSAVRISLTPRRLGVRVSIPI